MNRRARKTFEKMIRAAGRLEEGTVVQINVTHALWCKAARTGRTIDCACSPIIEKVRTVTKSKEIENDA